MGVSLEELQLAARNHGMPLEALRHDVTPVGLHYLLVHYDVPVVDAAAWRLDVAGAVERPLTLSLEELRERPQVSLPITFECAGNGRALLEPRPESQPWLREAVGTGEWTGTPLRALLAEAGLREEAVSIAFVGLDRGVEGEVEQSYTRALTVEEALAEDVLLAWGLNGAPLPPQHGFPLRLVVPGWFGMTNVKWLARIDVLDKPYSGYQHDVAYRWRVDEDDPGVPLARMVVRSLMVPPGIPDFFTRRRFVAPGRVELEGRAWSGAGPVERVEVSTDGGATWAQAALEPALGPYAWARWTFAWDASPGEVELCSRAFDATGAGQPDAPVWNVGGYANNAVQRVPVTVREPLEA
jgi:sulfane dehydrogenase subunit SoxC